MTDSVRRHLVAAFAFALAATGAVACQGGGDPADSPSASPSDRGYRPGKPVLAVKIDNVAAARPQAGLDRADIVYVEPVEAGLSRLLAVYSAPPRTLGPVRSARESDLELLRQYGRPLFAYSGAKSALLPTIKNAPLYDVSPARAGDGYFRKPGRRAPHNLYARPHRLLAHAPDAAPPADIGIEFGEAPAGGKRVDERTVAYQASRTTFSWSAKQRRLLVSMDGRPLRTAGGDRVGAATAVVQYVDIRPRGSKDKHGDVSPYVDTTGSGRAVVLRGGEAYRARWSRQGTDDGTTFTTESGKPMRFADGPLWVVFAKR